MPAWNSSSLAFSDHKLPRHNSGLLNNTHIRVSKQHLVEHKMFGSKRKGIQIGKKFKKVGKGILRGSISAHMTGNDKSSGVSPSIAEFDKMMSQIVGKGSKNGKSMFSRKSFG
jgi:hypothetical protein